MQKLPFTPLALAAVLLASGCSTLTSTPYTTPAVTLPAAWQVPAGAAATASVDAAWWQAYGEPGLDALMGEVLAHNHDLAAATVRLRTAQLEAGLVASNRLPVFGASAGVERREPLKGGGNGSDTVSAAVSVSYEVDLWGRLGDLRNAATWAARASAEDLESTALALSATTANLYWQLRYLDLRLALATQNLADAEKILALTQVRYRAGAVSGLDSAEAERNLATQRVAHDQLEQQRAATANALALLAAAPGRTFAPQPLAADAVTLPALDAGLPAALLARRPDLRAAEHRLRSAYRRIEASQASFYPALSLTGSAGGSSTALTQLLQNPVGVLGAGLVLPFLNWEQRRLDLRLSEADYEALVVEFRRRLQSAFTEVDDALSARRHLATQSALLQDALVAAQRAEQLYAIRYRAGAVALQDWLQAQDQRRSAEIALAATQLERLVNHATLAQALGGAPVTGITPARTGS